MLAIDPRKTELLILTTNKLGQNCYDIHSKVASKRSENTANSYEINKSYKPQSCWNKGSKDRISLHFCQEEYKI